MDVYDLVKDASRVVEASLDRVLGRGWPWGPTSDAPGPEGLLLAAMASAATRRKYHCFPEANYAKTNRSKKSKKSKPKSRLDLLILAEEFYAALELKMIGGADGKKKPAVQGLLADLKRVRTFRPNEGLELADGLELAGVHGVLVGCWNPRLTRWWQARYEGKSGNAGLEADLATKLRQRLEEATVYRPVPAGMDRQAEGGPQRLHLLLATFPPSR